MIIRNLLALAGVAFLLVLAAACQKSAPAPIKLGINPWPGYEFLYLAQEKGYYKELGVQVNIIEYGSLSDVRRGYERGSLDAMATTLIEVLQVKSNSARDPRIVLVTDFSDGGDVIIARKSIGDMSMLKGKKIGADTTSLPVFMLARALEKNGLSLSDVDVISLEQSDMEQAYIKGEIDAAVTYPPVSVRLLNRDNSMIVFSSKEIPGEIVDVLSVENSVIQSRPDDIKKIRQAWDKALKYAETHKQNAYEIMAKREGISVKDFAGALDDLKLVPLIEQAKYLPLLKKYLKNVRDVLVNTGALPKDASADCCIVD